MQTTRALGSRYLLERVLGSGAMGEVWAARDQRTGEAVAAKLLRPEFARDPEVLTRFVQERSILLDLVHPNVVRVRDLVVEGEDLAIVMDLVDGADLRARLRAAGTLPPAEAVRVVADVLGALAAAHGSGVLHRDVKPDNVLLTAAEPPAVLLGDFGIARLAQESAVRSTGVLGTADYLAPEVLTTETVGAAADVYGAGVVLYELLAGRPPFRGAGTGWAVAHRHVTAEPPALPGLPADLDAVLATLLAKEPSRRPTAAAAAEALRALLPALAGEPALPVQPEPQTWQPAEGGVRGFGLAAGPGAFDAEGTRVKGAGDARPAGPAESPAGATPWRAPGTDAALAEGTETQLRPLRAPVVDPPLAPAPPAPAAGRGRPDRRRAALVAGAAVVAAALVAVLVVVLGGRDGGSPAAARGSSGGGAEPVTALAPTEQLPSGLTTVREASYDAGAGTLTTTLTWTADQPLAGPLFEAVPAAEAGQPCPDVVWSVPAVRDATPGVPSTACGWQVPVDVPAGQPATATWTVPFDPGKGDVAGALRTRLQGAATATGDALDGLVATAAYPAQRLDSLDVQVAGVVRVGAPVDLVVLPVWRGTDAPDNVSVVFTSRAPQPNLLLQQLGGAIELRTDDCSGSLAFTASVPYANTVGSGCTIAVRLGDVDARSRTFDVLQNSTG